ncbi:MAG TPA: M48 family metalloprotease, partial [Planctomycetaceae bacterium]|nr:M48 family metalloprotease [Planctomycetaceae bacterium]
LATAAVFPAALLYVVGPADEMTLAQVVGLVFANALLLLRYQIPFRPKGHASPVPVESAEVLEAAERIARQMYIPTPTLRQFPANGTGAWAYSLVQPTVAVMEGVLYRLSPAERDAILAHEFAHFANRTLWILALMKVIAVSIGVLAISLPPGLPLVLTFLVYVGLKGIVSRWLEIDCDRRAARVVGIPAVMSGLEKIHALRGIANKGWLALLFDAVSSHPSRDVRLDELRRVAPNEVPTTVGPIGLLRYHRLASWVATALWLAALIAGCAYAHRFPVAVGIIWGAIAVFPAVLRLLVISPAQRQHARRLGYRRHLWPVAALLLACTLLGAAWLAMSLPTPDWLPLSFLGISVPTGLLFGAIAALASLQKDELRNQIRGAVNSRNYQQAVDLARKHPRRVQRDVISRHNVALAQLGLGHRGLALEEFRQLWEKHRFGFSGMWLTLIHLSEGRTEAALQMADGLAGVWTHDPAPPYLRGRALRRLGRLDEAEAAVRAMQRFEHPRGESLSLQAGIALDRGDLDSARELIRQAEAAAPGDVNVVAIAAEIAQQGGDPEAAAAITKAIQALERIPLPLLEYELAQLRSAHARLHPPADQDAATEITEFLRQE